MFFHIHIQEKMSENQVNRFYREKYSRPKICSNCNLQTTGDSWIMECFCGCNATARLCSTCLEDHSELFPSRKTQICFFCKLVECKKGKKI